MCGSCGQKYRGLSGNRSHRQLTRYRRLRGGKKEVVPDASTKVLESQVVTPVPTEEKKETVE